MFISGIADEAGKPIETQIKAHKELGWEHIEIRMVGPDNLTLCDDATFDHVEQAIKESGLKVSCFASALCNWSRKISGPFQLDFDELSRAIPRMHRLGTQMIRIMSYENDGWSEADWKKEAVKRLKELVKMAEGGGVTIVHENCTGWGGLGPAQSLELLDLMDSPNFKLLFDTGNPVPHKQDSWDYYMKTREHTAYVHIKDGKRRENGEFANFCFPCEGDGCVAEIIADLFARNYEGCISIEPHVAAIVHEEGNRSKEELCYESYITYGRMLNDIVSRASRS